MHLSVLVVDDDALIAELIGILLEDMGANVEVHTSPHEALDWLTGQLNVDLLITDVQMPLLDGIALGREARDLQPTMPIIFMSGYCDAFFRDSALLPSNSLFISKPFDARTVGHAVRKLCGLSLLTDDRFDEFR